MVKTLAKNAMTTKAQKACYVIDHLVEALGNEASSSLRRALVLVDIDQYPGSTQSGIMERLHIHKSAVNREIDWLFNYGCIMRQSCSEDGRAIKLETCGYSKRALDEALDYFNGNHDNMKGFLHQVIKALKQEKPTLRDAKIVALLHERKHADRHEVIGSLYKSSSSTHNRAINKLIEDGVIEDA